MGADQPTIDVKGTEKTPAVKLDARTGEFFISGCSIPENADRFFSPLFDLVESYSGKPAPRTTVHVRLTYFNSSSSKYLLDILKQLEDLHASGNSVVSMHWYHAAGDLDMEEAGHDYGSLLEFPVVVQEA
jgi:hypothetical protein